MQQRPLFIRTFRDRPLSHGLRERVYWAVAAEMLKLARIREQA